MQTIIKIFGLPRSCTNVTEVILNRNFKNRRILTNFPDWKHGENTQKDRTIHDDDRNIHTDDLKYVICLKNPYNWLWSIHTFENQTKWGQKRRRTPNQFLASTAWHYQKDEWTAIDAFNHLTKHWLTMYNDPEVLQVVRQDELLTPEGQISFCERIEKQFGMDRRRKKFHQIEKTVGPACKIREQNFALNKQSFNKKQIEKINSLLDWDVVKLAGFEGLENGEKSSQEGPAKEKGG